MTVWNDRSRHFASIIFIVAAFVVIDDLFVLASRNEAIRTATHTEAIYDVDAEALDIDGLTAIVSGTFKKRRCIFVRNSYFTKDTEGRLTPARVGPTTPITDDTWLAANGNVMPFGPWVVESTVKDPQALVIMNIMACPEGVLPSTFIELPWIPFSLQ